MKAILILILVLPSFLATRECSSSPKAPLPNQSVSSSGVRDANTPPLNRQLEIPYGKSVRLTDATNGVTLNAEIKFLAVEDSRCPQGVQCIRAGEAKAKFSICAAEGNAKCEAMTFELSTPAMPNDSSQQSEITLGAYTIRLLDVTPYQRGENQIETSQYVATLNVTGN